MTTPAQQRGIIENVTKLKLIDNGAYAGSDVSETWVLSQDDGSHHPFFQPIGRVGDYNYERVFTLANMEVMAEALPKFPVGSRVKVVASGWGLGPEYLGEVLTVTGFSFNGDHTSYSVVGEAGDQVGGSPWEQSFEAAPATLPPPPVDMSFLDDFVGVPAIPSPYTDLQQTAINVFQAMYDAAVAYRNGATDGLSVKLNPDYGICDNIDRFANANGSHETPMSEVKENLIRQTEIYSGNYTYPVPCPDGGDASNAFSRHCAKWNGPYGLNRLIQLGQLIDLIKSDKWDDSMVKRKTPAFRNGLTVGDMVVSTRRTEPSYWIFRHDDESMSPSFHKIGDPDDYTDIDLNYIRKIDQAQLEERTVSQFLEELKAKQEEQDAICKQIAELQAALAVNKSAIALLDFGLAQQHKVKRIS
ncbi:hypothetical protein QGX11_gp097 [Pseudomonas phage PPSC2]|uniref:Uncharacterized protein n=1 Tax=Pseudomonas phage PPSC2 TaxID=2041350 RepID=A0A2R2YAY4_9CAUD|nr:hypothetical protein QGX11_gp097 [Pseudomonas phage PPSC2]ATN92860.1 hypothetical protein PPSC2_97 [Pseudomonas phage PPSC2]